MTSREFGERTGHIDLIDYNLAVARGLGAQYDDVKGQYFLPLTDEQGNPIFIQPEGSDASEQITRALVVYKQSEPTHTEFDLPAVLIARDDWSWAEQREWSPNTPQYRVPAEGAKRVSAGGCLGWDCYETRERDWQADLTYTIEVWARKRLTAEVLHQMVLRRFPPRGSLTVTDGLGVERVYHTFFEGTADLTEINSLVDRICGFSVNFRVEGELSFDRVPTVERVFIGTPLPPGVGPGDPGFPPGFPGGGDPGDPNGGYPDPGPGGIYADGQPCKRVTAYGGDE